MRAALLVAAHGASNTELAHIIFGSARSIKAPSSIGGWNVDRKGKGNGRRSR